jgi:hypothetical protein
MNKPGTLKFWLVLTALLGALLTGIAGLAVAGPAAGIAGDWEGTLDTGGGSLRVVVHITQDKDGKLGGAIDSPDQGASGIEITAITYKAPALHFEVDSINGAYDGKMNSEDSQIAGDWKQNGASLPLSLKRVAK